MSAAWGKISLFIQLFLMVLYVGAPPAFADAFQPADPDGFKARLEAGLEHRAFRGAKVGVSVVDCHSGENLFQSQAQQRLNPASNLKLFTAVTALDVLGPAYRFRTTLFTDGPLEEGVLKGNLYLKGGGDPELVYEEVWKVSQELTALGIRKIEGDLILDEQFFDQTRRIPDWIVDGDDFSRAYYAPLGALSFNFNTVAIVIRPGKAVGEPAIITMETPTQHIRILNEVTTIAGKRGRGLKAELVPGTHPLELRVTGRAGLEQSPRRFYRAIESPLGFAQSLLLEHFDKEGIAVTGQARSGVVPEGAEVIHSLSSSSLDVILKYMNKLSSNFIAEQTLKTISATVHGAPGSTAGGVQAIQETLEARGVWESGMVLSNGSGLSNNSRVSATDFTRLLVNVEKDPRIKWEFISSLPIAGVDGTLRRRMVNSAAQGMVRAKTGSLDGVYAMSGYAIRDTGDMVAFSIIANDLTASRTEVRGAMEGLITTLIDWPAHDALLVNEEGGRKPSDLESSEVAN